MNVVAPLFAVLGPGMAVFCVAAAVARRKVTCLWWEYVAPWIAPTAWLSLNFAAPRNPPKSLGNLVEILGLSMLPAAYLLIRAIGWRSRPEGVNGLSVSGVAAIAAAIIYFTIPSLPE